MDVLDSPYQVASLKSSFYETMLKVAPKDNSLNKVYLAQMVDNDRWVDVHTKQQLEQLDLLTPFLPELGFSRANSYWSHSETYV